MNIRRWLRAFFFAMTLGLVVWVSSGLGSEAGPRPKVLMLYGAGGHATAAKAIASRIQLTNPNAEVILADIATLVSKKKAPVYEDLSSFGMNYVPELFRVFASEPMIAAAREAKTISDRPTFRMASSPMALLKYIQTVNPTAIVSTHFLATESLAYLREQSLLDKTPVAWQHTDLIPETFFAQLSAYVDMTFTPHEEITKNWIERGIPSDRVATTGITVNPIYEKKWTALEIQELKKEMKITPEKKTIVIMGGTFGVLKYDEILDGLATQYREPLRLIAVTGKNEKQKAILDQIQVGTKRLPSGRRLPSNFELRTTGLIPQDQLLKYLAVSDLVVTKPGGLTSFELIRMGKPTVYLVAHPGHEAFNARFIEERGAARVTYRAKEVGTTAQKILSDPDLTNAMIQAQKVFSESFSPDLITKWALNPPPVHHPLVVNHPLVPVGDTVLLKGMNQVCPALYRNIFKKIFPID